MGKSRLIYEFSLSQRSQGWLTLESGSVSYGQTPSYFPVTRLLNSYFKIRDGDDPARSREKVTERLLLLDKSLESMLPALLALFRMCPWTMCRGASWTRRTVASGRSPRSSACFSVKRRSIPCSWSSRTFT